MSIFQNYIDGRWASSDAATKNINPSNTDDIVGEYAHADKNQADAAIAAAVEASKSWRYSGIQQRFDILDTIGSEILARKDELGRLLAREEGKILPEATGEVVRAGQIFKFFAGEALRVQGEHLKSVRPGVEVEVTRGAVGVIGIITPWNFPIAIPAWKIAPALAYGNTVVFKPAELVPGSAWALSDIIARSGLPNGVFNLVMGSGREVGQAMLDDRRIDAVSFTGSVNTGGVVAASCSRRGAKYQLEMGGKNPLIVLADADIDNAVACALNGAYFSTGQRCTASSRLIVVAPVYDQFIEALKSKVENLIVGDALADGTQIGPVVDQRQLDQNIRYVDIGKEEGAELLCGGELLERETPGFYMTPALFTETSNKMQINREEIFGPVASVIKASDIDESISLANDTEFGLSAGICTTSLSAATKFKQECRAGMVMVNLPTAGVDYHVPFGGMKGSSYGSREQGRYAAEFYTTVKTAYVGA
ncbi:aldehyde dehydrogenase family protein [Hyphococcus flavus]|uniref:Aldehyde dehydrogenase family protein n=2 Tax=Hyphococcus flavus TaxID=1866326 RepID=A0AAE9Z9W3_9PROT|nr:aldehyde dehydrogenase family protein [Hyphococcus flavus]WDI30129.1 aldehyde dehydrogenase family protein [Hyphococcus flavus]